MSTPDPSSDQQDKKSTPPELKPAGEPPKGPRRPPLAPWQYAFWLLLIVIIPLIAYYGSKGGDAPHELTQKQFEDILRSGRIVKLNITDSNSAAVRTVSGSYKEEQVSAQDGTVIKEATEQNFVTQVMYSNALDGMIRQYAPQYSAEPGGNSFTGLLYMLMPTVLLIAFFYFIFVRQMRGGSGMMEFGKSRARRLDPDKEPITFDQVAGCDEAKEDMQEIVEYLKDPAKFTRLGGKIPRGVLLAGPPGTGKTLLAKAIAGEAKVPFFSISGSDFVEMFVGVGASRVRDMFEEGKKNAPCLIFIDEIDAVGRSRFSGIGGGHDEREQTLNALLVEMDGFETNQGVIVIAATNRPDVLDPALLRPGRFDRQITVDLPDLRGRLAILKIHARKTKLAPEVDLRLIARGTPGFSGADLANIINEAALLATRHNSEAVTMAELEEARDKVHWGKERRSHRMDDKVRRLTAFHEAGHALLGMLCPNCIPLHKITIIPRGQALGATMSLPENDQVTMSRNELLDQICMTFGGRIAEELTMEDISTGAAMDIRQATDIAKKMVCQWGMSKHLGLVNYAGHHEPLFLGRDMSRAEDFSPETAREIDLEIRLIIDEQRTRAEKLLKDNQDKLELLATTLLERETMNASEVYALLGMEEPKSKRSAEDLAHDFGDPIEEALKHQIELPCIPEEASANAAASDDTTTDADAPKANDTAADGPKAEAETEAKDDSK